jgi:hypothetical protein
MISNKTQPKKFEYEIVGESYEWWPYKSVIQWINEKTEEGLFTSLNDGYLYVLSNNVSAIRLNPDYSDFPVTDLEYRSSMTPYVYAKLPYLKIELTDKYGRQDKSYHPDAEDYWKFIRPRREIKPREYDYSFNTNETVIKYDEQLNEYRVHDEQLGNDMWKYGRVRGNMQYLEDYWNIEIRPINFKWCWLADSNLNIVRNPKATCEYSGDSITKLTNLQGVLTQFKVTNDESKPRLLEFNVFGSSGKPTIIKGTPSLQ